MALLNIAQIAFRCPHCSNAVAGWGLEFDAGRLVRAEARIGDHIPLRDGQLPIGVWSAEGLGKCPSCSEWVDATCWFEADRLIGVAVKGGDTIGIVPELNA